MNQPATKTAVEKPEGLTCPSCECPQSDVYYTRRRSLTINGQTVGRIVRRRQCRHCARLFLTNEVVSGC